MSGRVLPLVVVAALLSASAARAAADEPAVAAKPATTAGTTARTKRIAGVATILVGAACIAAGGYYSARAASDSEFISALFFAGGVWNSSARNAEAEGRRAETTSHVLYGLGAAAAVAGIAVAVVGWRQGRREAHLTVAPTVGGAAFTWSASF